MTDQRAYHLGQAIGAIIGLVLLVLALVLLILTVRWAFHLVTR